MQEKKGKEDGFNLIFWRKATVVSFAFGAFAGGIYYVLETIANFTDVTASVFTVVVVGIIIILLAVVAYAAAAGKFNSIDERLIKIDVQIDSLTNSVDILKNSVASLTNSVDILKDSVGSLTGLVNQALGRLGLTAKEGMVSANSPITLNEKGKKTASGMKADDIIEKYKDSLIKKLNAQNIKNAYDVQVACLNMTNETWAEILAPETLDKIKELAFNNGVGLEDCYIVLGLKLRDAILDMRNEKLADVDEHSPGDSTD